MGGIDLRVGEICSWFDGVVDVLTFGMREDADGLEKIRKASGKKLKNDMG